MPRLRIGLAALNAAIAAAPRAIVGRALAAVDQLRQDVVLDLHAVGRDVAAVAVEIALAHIERIEAERPGDLVDRALDAIMPCGPPKPRNAVFDTVLVFIRLVMMRRGRQVIGVVGVEHGAVVDRARQIGRIAAARGQHARARGCVPFVVEADLVVGAEIVPLAGHDHVVVAVEPQLARPPGHARGERRDRGPLRRLGLLAAEGAAHAAHFDRDRGVRNVEHLGDQVLNSLGCWVEE